MKVVLVDPADLGQRMPHLFTLKAVTYWTQQGAEVRTVRGADLPLWAWEFDPDLVQVTTPLFSWFLADAVRAVASWSRRSADVEVGGVLASSFAKDLSDAGGKVRPGIWWEVESSPPACDAVPGIPISRFFATHGCGGCPLGLMIDPDVGETACLVPRFEGRSIREVPGWQAHVCDAHGGLRELMDNALNMASSDVLWRVREAITKPTNLSSGVEANTFDDRAGEILAPVPFRPWRTAFDETREERGVARTFDILEQHGVAPERVHVYVLYGHRDDLEDAIHRATWVLQRGGWPFAMRYVPLNWRGGKHDYLPPNWSREDYMNFGRWVNTLKVTGLAKGWKPQVERVVPYARWLADGAGHARPQG